MLPDPKTGAIKGDPLNEVMNVGHVLGDVEISWCAIEVIG